MNLGNCSELISLEIKEKYKINFPFTSILKYSGVALIASIILYGLSETMLTYTESIYEFIPQIIPILIIGGGIYFGITFLIDESAKKLFKSIIKETLLKRIRSVYLRFKS